jgi:hypothetical protein
MHFEHSPHYLVFVYLLAFSTIFTTTNTCVSTHTLHVMCAHTHSHSHSLTYLHTCALTHSHSHSHSHPHTTHRCGTLRQDWRRLHHSTPIDSGSPGSHGSHCTHPPHQTHADSRLHQRTQLSNSGIFALRGKSK